MTTAHLSNAFQSLRQARAALRSPEVVAFLAGSLGQRRAFTLADPTGHVIEMIEKP